MTHLKNSSYIGRLVCGRNQSTTHNDKYPVYAPLHDADYRAQLCPDCLRLYAIGAYQSGDDMPAWVQPYHGVAP